MRIAFLLTQDLESPSGLGRYWPLSKALVRLGHQVTILALHSDFAALTERRARREGVDIHYVSQMHVHKVGSRKAYFTPMRLLWVAVLGAWKLTRAALHSPADVYHICKPHPMNGLAGLIAGGLLGKPVYLDCDDYEAASNRFSGRWQRWILTLFEDWLPKVVSGVTVNTRFLRDRVASLGVPESRIVYVPNGVDRERFEVIRPDRMEELGRTWRLGGKRAVIYAGSMSLASHPVGLLISAFAEVVPLAKDTVLLLVGGGEDLETLKEQARGLGIEDATRFVGRVAPDQVPAFLALADVSVDPVLDDDVARARSPLKVFESLAAGTPVITGDVGDRRAFLGDGRVGSLVAPGRVSDLAEGILARLQEQVTREMREAAVEAVAQYYWDVLVHDFAAVYAMAAPKGAKV